MVTRPYQDNEIPIVESPMPSIGDDLVAIEAAGYFKGMRADRAMATLELLRHGEITPEQAAILLGMSGREFKQFLSKLPLKVFQRIA